MAYRIGEPTLQAVAAADDPRGLHDGLGRSRGGSPRDSADVTYEGLGFPKLADVNYLRPTALDGAFHVERWLADSIGEFGAMLRGDDGKVWAVFDIDAIEWIE